MGMFDNISFSGVLPYSDEMVALGLNVNDRSFQTKDLHNCMSDYIIQDNMLFIRKYKNSKFVEGEPKSDHFLDRIGYIKQEDPYLERVMHHGSITFYDYRQDVAGTWDCWFEFTSIFTHGVLESTTLTEFRKTDNTERKVQHAKWMAEIEHRNNVWYNKYLFHTWLFRKIRKMWYRAFNSLSRMFTWLANAFTWISWL